MGRFAIAVDEALHHELAVEREHLHALAAAIRNIDETVVRYPRGVDRLHELQRAGSGQLLGRDAVAFRHLRRSWDVVERLIAERAPHALERAGIGIEHDDAAGAPTPPPAAILLARPPPHC